MRREQTIESESIESKEQQLERNLLTETLDTIKAMAEIEGPGWFSEQEAVDREITSPGEYVTSLVNALERAQAGDPATINGKGSNRWLVEGDGRVSFSKTHAESPELIERVRALGFEIVP